MSMRARVMSVGESLKPKCPSRQVSVAYGQVLELRHWALLFAGNKLHGNESAVNT